MSNRHLDRSLAIDGGKKAVDGYEGTGEPKIGHEEFLEIADTWGYSAATIARIREAVEREDLGNGPFLARYQPDSKVARLEREVAEMFDVPYVLAVTSGTAALHTAHVAADVGCGDEVIVPGYTFMATAMATVVARGVPVWCEIDESMTISPADIEKRLTSRTKAIAPVHMNGYVCDMDAVMTVARRHGLLVIEDCAQACGARFRGRRVGTIGDIGCFSISSYKTTGGAEGGLIMTKDPRLFARAQGWAEAGGLWRPDRFAPSRWPGELFCGLNYRMSELEGALDLIQFRKLDAQLNRWRANKRRILADLGVYVEITPQKIIDLDGEMGHTIGFFAQSAHEAERHVAALRAEGVACGTRGTSTRPDWHYYQHMEAIMRKLSATSDGCPWSCPRASEAASIRYSRDMCPRTLDLTSRHVAVPISQWWTAHDCARVAQALTKVFDAYDTPDPKRGSWLEAAAG